MASAAARASSAGAASLGAADLTAGVDSIADAGSKDAVDLGPAPLRADQAASLTARPAAGSAVAPLAEASPVAAGTVAAMAADIANLRS